MNDISRPYQPSYIDRLNQAVVALPIRPWIFYSALGVVLVLFQLLFLWVDGGLDAEELLPIVIFNGLAVPYILILIKSLDGQAIANFQSMRPVLDLKEQDIGQYRYLLGNMPFWAPLIAGLALTVATILTPLITLEPARYSVLEHLPVFSVVYHIIDKMSAFLMGVFIYHTIRQLRLVNAIYSRHVRVNLLHVNTVRAFSGLTASTAVGLLIFVYGWIFINPDLLADPVLLVYIMLFTLMAITVFIWPLWGAHKLLRNKKDEVLREINLQYEAVVAKFSQDFKEGDYAATDALAGTITSLDIQHRKISDIPTWPWSSESAQLTLTAIAFPLILMIIQLFVLQVVNG